MKNARQLHRSRRALAWLLLCRLLHPRGDFRGDLVGREAGRVQQFSAGGAAALQAVEGAGNDVLAAQTAGDIAAQPGDCLLYTSDAADE